MRIIVETCEATHGEHQGYYCDDWLSTKCYVANVNDEEFTALKAIEEELIERDIRRTKMKEKECGEEIVGPHPLLVGSITISVKDYPGRPDPKDYTKQQLMPMLEHIMLVTKRKDEW